MKKWLILILILIAPALAIAEEPAPEPVPEPDSCEVQLLQAQNLIISLQYQLSQYQAREQMERNNAKIRELKADKTKEVGEEGVK